MLRLAVLLVDILHYVQCFDRFGCSMLVHPFSGFLLHYVQPVLSYGMTYYCRLLVQRLPSFHHDIFGFLPSTVCWLIMVIRLVARTVGRIVSLSWPSDVGVIVSRLNGRGFCDITCDAPVPMADNYCTTCKASGASKYQASLMTPVHIVHYVHHQNYLKAQRSP